ncbi:hypothetical protein HPB52_010975 [Rhipicephalus sanguineus]|uniref:Uncharacterized protein n=1 Tax=Rhipicephalus sanguineus TaxID=34632 RepID=A0A9D4SY68_RHISA|nr:hypothetical protein HPB52_010975 [Rhipicephalus sanguineus]
MFDEFTLCRARDTLTDAIKANCTGRASQQGNALLALCALLEATTEHLQGLDTGARRQAARNHTAWAHALLDLVSQCCGLIREEPPDRTHSFQWLLKASSGMLVRGCASTAVGGLLGLLHRRDPHCVVPLLEALAERLLAAEGGPTGQVLTGAGLAACVAAAVRLGLVDAASDAGVRAVVLRVVKQLLSACLGNTISEPNSIIAFKIMLKVPLEILCAAGKVGFCTMLNPVNDFHLRSRGDEELWQMVVNSCALFCQDLHAADPDTCSFETLASILSRLCRCDSPVPSMSPQRRIKPNTAATSTVEYACVAAASSGRSLLPPELSAWASWVPATDRSYNVLVS